MKKYIAALLALLLLTGCEGESIPSPFPESTSAPEPVSTLELDLGEGLRSFWVELARPGEPGELRVDVYKA